MKLVLTNPKLFYKKIAVLFIATLILVPLIHFKLLIPANIYLITLLALHIVFFYVYFSRVPWRQFLKDKKTLTLRLAGILFFIYLLAILRFTGSTVSIMMNILGALFIHVLILLFLMTARVELKRPIEDKSL